MLITKREEVTKQSFCKVLWRKLRPRGSLLLELNHLSGWGGGERLFEFDWEEEGVRLFEAGRLLTFSAFRMGANSRLGAYSNKYGSCFSKTSTLPTLGLQSRDKAVMLVVKSIIFSQEFISKWCSLPVGEKYFVLDPARTWPPWRHVQTGNTYP